MLVVEDKRMFDYIFCDLATFFNNQRSNIAAKSQLGIFNSPIKFSESSNKHQEIILRRGYSIKEFA